MRVTAHSTTLILFLIIVSFIERPPELKTSLIARGQMPSLAGDNQHNIHLVWGNSDSILYASSINNGVAFSKPVLVTILPGLAASGSRGPQIANTISGITVTACNQAGDIFSYLKDASGKWSVGTRVNDIDNAAKEGLMETVTYILFNHPMEDKPSEKLKN